jgi:predicted esterase YcpF (UPF0227 family)
MILYIHGFGGSGHGVKASLFKRAGFACDVIAPTLSYVPEPAVSTLCEIIELCRKKGETVHLVGSSLGGYYALYLSQRYDLKAVLLNPSVYPMVTLSKWTGQARNYYDESTFTWNDAHVAMLRQFEVTTLNAPENIFLLLESGDETLDYTKALEKLPGVKTTVEEGGSHSFDSIESYLPDIAHFFGVGYA